jgi:DNA-binding transcriptional ArsR family regulator
MDEDGDTAVEGSGGDPAAAFDALGEDTRVGIVRALIEHRREDPENPALSFSDLRRRVGARDSGGFNYHLDKLRGQFVEQTDDGYRLTYAGVEMATAILSGSFGTDLSLGPTELPDPCPLCDSAIAASYEGGYVEVSCADDHTLFRRGFPPGAAEGRSMTELLSLATFQMYAELSLSVRGTCPACYGPMHTELSEETYSDDVERYGYVATCERCGQMHTATVGGAIVQHPAVVAFYWAHGEDIRELAPWNLGFMGGEDAVAVDSTDPLRVAVRVTLDDETLTVTLDGAARVVAVDDPD